MKKILYATALAKTVSATGFLIALFVGILSGTKASAQIIPDDTLPMNSVIPTGCATCTITGGTIVGNNLFHSFQQFSIDGTTINTAFFNNSVTIDNIITRITGIDQSFINGLISANGGANLFLINPNGLVFGPNATLNIGGSFIGSTAESIQFAGGRSYSAVNPQAPPLLAVNIPTGLQFRPNPAPIQVQGPGNFLFIDDPLHFETVTAFRPPGLQVAPSQTLALVGGDVTLQGGNLTAIDGRVETGAVRGFGVVSITPSVMGFTLGYNDINNFADVRLINESSIDVSGNGIGQVQVQGLQVVVTDASAILANTRGVGTGGQIIVNAAESLEVSGFRPFDPNKPFGPLPVTPPFISQLSTDVASSSPGTGGVIEINTGALGLLDGGQLSADIFGSGIGGTININTGRIFATGVALDTQNAASGIFAEVRPGVSGQGGAINIDTGFLTLLDGAQIRTGTFASGNAGTLNIRAENIEAVFGSQLGPSGIFSSSQPGASGNGGTINIEAQRLTLINGASIGVNTFGEGDSGTLNVNAAQIELLGAAFGDFPSSLTVSVEPGATGNGGTLVLNTGNLSLVDGGQIQNITFGTGNAGNAQITANTIEVLGTTPTGFPSGIFSSVEASAFANGGSLSIMTDNLSIKDGGQIISSTFGIGDAGLLEIHARQIKITGLGSRLPSSIVATVERDAVGRGGNIRITTDELLLTESAQIISSTFGQGDAGLIQIQANEILLVGGINDIFPTSILAAIEPSAIGNAGDLSINTSSLLISNGAQIQSSNQGGQGNAGSLEINAENIELIGTSTPLPGNNEIFPSGILANVGSGAIGNGGNIRVKTDHLQLVNGAQISSSIFGQGEAGSLIIEARQLELIGSSTSLQGNNEIFPSGILANVGLGAIGNGGNIRISTDHLRLANGVQISSSIFGRGEAGSLLIEAKQLEVIGTSASIPGNGIIPSGILSTLEPEAIGKGGDLNVITDNLSVQDGGQIATTTAGDGDAGDLILTAQNIALSGTSSIGRSGLLANATNNSPGRGGNIFINTDQITLKDGAMLTVSNFASLNPDLPPGQGPAGNITLDARNLLLDGGIITAETVTGTDSNITLKVTEAINLNNNAQITTNERGSGTGGNININTRDLSIESGSQISAEANSGTGGNIELFGLEILDVNNSNVTASTKTGQAGNLSIKAAKSVQISGQGGLFAESTDGGNAGTISIRSPITNVLDGAQLTVSSPSGQAGDLTINGNSLYLNQGTISAQTGEIGEAEGANIDLNLFSFVILENESLISAMASNEANGGNVTINTPFLFVASPTGSNGSDIIASAVEGRGGNILVNSFGVFGIAERVAIPGNQTNDLDASSQFGTSGQVLLTNTIDPNRGAIQLSEEVVDPSQLVAKNPCKQGRSSQFTRTGRGGLPPTPTDNLSSEATEVDLVEPAPFVGETQINKKIDNNQPIKTKKEKEIIPAQGWVFNENGNVVLTAYTPTVTSSQRIRTAPEACPRLYPE